MQNGLFINLFTGKVVLPKKDELKMIAKKRKMLKAQGKNSAGNEKNSN